MTFFETQSEMDTTNQEHSSSSPSSTPFMDDDRDRTLSSTRIPPPPGFLTLSPGSDALNYRGQALQNLIQSRSTTHLLSYDQDVETGSISQDEDGLSIPGFRRRRSSFGFEALVAPQMRSMRLIGNSNPRYQWSQYFKTEEELKKLRKPLRKYYERNNGLIAQYHYIDRLLDSSLPHNLLQEYSRPVEIPTTIDEESSSISTDVPTPEEPITPTNGNNPSKVKRTPKALYRVPTEISPLLNDDDSDRDVEEVQAMLAAPDEDVDSDDPIVTVAIAINFAANSTLLALKIAAAVLTSSLSVLASLVDAALDFLSTAIVWMTARLISHSATDPYGYPAGRRRLEPIGVLVFGVIMITSFVQVAIESITRLTSGNREVVQLSLPAILIMAATVVIKLACWFWCRLVRNSSVQALAEDAMTDVVFNTFSIIFPLLGYWLKIWWLDALGGLFLSIYVIVNWARVSASHIRNLSGAAADADRRNILLYLTMRFAKTIKQIQGMTAYHAGDKLICEVDIVLDETTQLRDSHDLGESLQYVLESVPFVDRAFVHMDYRSDNLPTHMNQRES